MKLTRTRTAALFLVMASLLIAGTGCASGKSGSSDELRLDYAYYNPASLVLRQQHWIEDELKSKGIKVTWQFSAGSNKANENLRADAIDVGSTAGAAALLARANGTPLKTISVFSQPEWAALVVRKDSPITSVSQLKGKKVAATKGTDPYFFLLQALTSAGLSASDVTTVNLQHSDGKTALERGSVDAWAGLDPYIAQTQHEAGSRLLYRNLSFNSYGVLNARESFIADHPDLVQVVVDQYERAKKWISDHHEQTVTLLAKESKVAPSVARTVLDRTRFDVGPVPGAGTRQVLTRILPVLVADKNVRSQQAGQTALDSLYEPKFALAGKKS